MIEDPRGRIDYQENGTGPTVVLVPGSCSTGAAWRPIMSQWGGQFRCVTTSLLGYGGTAERRTADDPDIAHEAEALETVLRRTEDRVHLVGHSFGGLVSLVVALRQRVPLASLTIVEAPAAEILRALDEPVHYQTFRAMTDAYHRDFESGNTQAVAAMIDFYGGAGTFASWPPRVRAYAEETTAVNILDWASAYGYPLTAAALNAIDIPVLVMKGGDSKACVQRANALVSACIDGAGLVTVAGAAHFMIATHAAEVAAHIGRHVLSAA